MYPVKHANISAAADGENEIVAAVAGKRIVVISYVLAAVHATAAAAADFRSGTSNTVHATFLSGQADLHDAVVYSFTGHPKAPAFECDIGDSLAINNAAGVDCFGHLTYMVR